LLSAKVEHSATEFSTLWNGSPVHVRISETGQSYDLTTFIREMDALATSLHPSILRMKAISIPPSNAAAAAASRSSFNVSVPTLAVIREPIEAQPLSNVIGTDRRRWTFERILHVGVQLAEAISELHMFGVILRDLHPGNILITPVGDVKLGDFGLARYNTARKVQLQNSPLEYRSPEMLEQIVSYERASKSGAVVNLSLVGSVKSDVYSFGCVLYAVAVGYEVWKGKNDAEIRTAVLMERRVPAIPEDTEAQLAAVLKKCLTHNANERPSFDELATALRAIADVSKKIAPYGAVNQVAPFGWASLVSLCASCRSRDNTLAVF
jgi:serine/threonine protein kinase